MGAAKHIDVVVAGLAVVDCIGRPVDFRRLPKRGGLNLIDSVSLTTGGNVSNVGIDLAKLGFRVEGITRVGNDPLGRFVTQLYEENGMGIKGVTIDPKEQTSSTIVCVANDGERSFLHTRGCMVNFRAKDVLVHMPMLKRAKIVAFGYFGLLPETEKDFPTLFKEIKKKTSAEIFLDTGGVPKASRAFMRKFLPFVDYFIPSHEEAAELTGLRKPEEIVKFFVESGAAGVVGVKLGARGSYVYDGDRGRYIKPRRVRKVVDTTGAGDAYVAGFLAATLSGRDPFEAAEIAGSVAASCVTEVGASTAIRPYGSYDPRSQKSKIRSQKWA